MKQAKYLYKVRYTHNAQEYIDYYFHPREIDALITVLKHFELSIIDLRDGTVKVIQL